MKEETSKLLMKAERALKAAEVLLSSGDAEFASGRAYYAMLHTAQALLREKDLRYRKHAGVHAAFGEHFAKTGILDPKYHRWLLAAFDARLMGDYDFNSDLDATDAAEMIHRARTFIDTARRYLSETSS